MTVSQDHAPTNTAVTSGHTPGPWRLFTTRDGCKLIGIGEINGEGITDAGFGTWRDGEEQFANARLIAAAPDLLEALKALQIQALQSSDLCRHEWGQEALEMTRAAIAKTEAA